MNVMGEIRKSSFVTADKPVPDIVSDDGSVMSLSRDALTDQIFCLTQLVQEMSVRLKTLEESRSSTSDSSRLDKPSLNECVVDDTSLKYVLFSREDTNPKGGVHQFDHLEQVYLSDEKKEAIVYAEARVYAWVLVADEVETRRKMKTKLKRLRR